MNVLLVLAAVAGFAACALGDATCVTSADAAEEFEFNELGGFLASFGDNPRIAPLLSANTDTVPLPPDESVTIFTPSNAAVAEVSDILSTLSADALAGVFLSGIVQDLLPSDDLLEGFEGQSPGNPVTFSVPNVLGADLEFSTSGGDLFVTDTGSGVTAKVIETDILVCTGIVHVIDAVFLPMAPAPEGVDMGGEGGMYGGEDGAYGF